MGSELFVLIKRSYCVYVFLSFLVGIVFFWVDRNSYVYGLYLFLFVYNFMRNINHIT